MQIMLPNPLVKVLLLDHMCPMSSVRTACSHISATAALTHVHKHIITSKATSIKATKFAHCANAIWQTVVAQNR